MSRIRPEDDLVSGTDEPERYNEIVRSRTKPDLMEEALSVIDFAAEAKGLKHAVAASAYPSADGGADIDNHALPQIEITLRDVAERAAARAIAAAEQRGREEERKKLAKRYIEEAKRQEQIASETLSVVHKVRCEATAKQCREFAAAIRRGTP